MWINVNMYEHIVMRLKKPIILWWEELGKRKDRGLNRVWANQQGNQSRRVEAD